MLTFIVTFLLLLSSQPPTVLSAKCGNRAAAAKTFKKCTSLLSQDASIAWTFHHHNATLDIAFFGSFISPSGWVGWGINPTSAEMAGTRALIAFPDPNSGQLVLLPYIIDDTVKLQQAPLLSRPLDIHLLSSSASMYGGRTDTIHDGATVEIYASVKLAPNRTRIHLVWNRGLYVQGYSPTIHPTTTNDLSSISTVNILTGGTSAKSHNRDFTTLKTVHGAMNAVSWGIMLPVGAVTARYLRHIHSLGPTWFYVHAGIQLSGIAIGSIGFGIGVRLGEGGAHGVHLKLGIAAFSLGISQTLAMFFRPKTTNRFRKYWKSYHHLVGYACLVVGVVNVFQGFQLLGGGGEGEGHGMLLYCLCLSALIGACVALEVNSWIMASRRQGSSVTVGAPDHDKSSASL